MDTFPFATIVKLSPVDIVSISIMLALVIEIVPPAVEEASVTLLPPALTVRIHRGIGRRA